MPLKWSAWPGAYCASQLARVGCTSPASSGARLNKVEGLPFQFHGIRNRVSAFGNTGAGRAARAQVRPPSLDTSTFAIRPAPDHASPEISYNRGPLRFIPKEGLRITDFAPIGNMY